MPNRSLDDYFAEDDEETEPTESSTADAAGTGDADPDTESDTDANTESDTDANTESDTDANTESDTEGDMESNTVDNTDADTESDVNTLATYRWTPDGTPCPQCGESVKKQWLDGDEYVCIDCKDW